MIFKRGQELELTIDSVVYGGEGLAKTNNFIVFVPKTVPNDKIKAEIISVKSSYARALVKELMEPSEYRVKPKCPVTDDCGGCQWQEIDYKKQLEFKEKNLLEALNKIAGFDLDYLESIKEPIISSDNQFFYRNKAQFPFAFLNGKIKAGFYKEKSHDIVEIDKCYIQNDKINHIFRKIKEIIIRDKISCYDEKRKKGLIKNIIVRHAFFTDQILIGFVTSEYNFDGIKKIVKELTKEFPEIKSIVQNINDKNTNVILGTKNINHFGEGYIIEQLKDIKYRVSLNSFLQVNPVQTINLYQKVIDFCEPKKEDIILDAFAGAGSIGLLLTKYVKKVIGIEVVQEAVKDGIENANINNINNFQFILGTVEDRIPEVLEKNKINTIILDPPRKGCEPHIFDVIDKNVKKIIYVSCNPSTLARDSKFLIDIGYNLVKFQAFDMFPHTYHVETVALFELRNN